MPREQWIKSDAAIDSALCRAHTVVAQFLVLVAFSCRRWRAGPLRQEVAARNVDFAISRFARPASEEYSEEILFQDALVEAAARTIH